MNSTGTRIFNTASQEAFSNYCSMSSERSVYIMPNDEDTSVKLGIREMTRKKWEDLKPLIEQTYIKENQPFQYLAEVLRRDYGFEPTKRQFSRKIIQWGFRKNVSRSERRLILDQLPRDSGKAMPDFKDCRLKQKKLNNWRRRYKDEVRTRPCPSSQGGRNCQETLSTTEYEAAKGGGEINHHTRKESMTENSHHLDGAPQTDSVGIYFMDMCQNGVPFEWSTLDATGFPEILPLFKALRSEWFTPDQRFPFDAVESDAITVLSNSELQELSYNRSHVKTDDSYTCLSIRTKSMEPIAYRTKYRSPQYPWRDIQSVFCGYSTSPLNEIYVFPPFQQSLRTRDARVENLCGSLTVEASELEKKLFKLNEQFGTNNPAVVAIMEHLAALYERLDYYRKAELMRRRLVDIYGQVLGPTNRRTLQAGLAVVESLLVQGQLLKAETENRTLRSSILRIFEHDHPLVVSANYAYGKIYHAHGKTEEAEQYFRQHLQTMLSLHGPRAMETIKAMSSLSDEIGQRKPKEAEILLRTLGQLLIESPRVDEIPCRSLRFVVNKLRVRGAYEESYWVATKLLERFSLPLGDQHHAIWKAQERLAWSMSAMGNLQMSVKMFRAIISHQRERALELDQSDANLWCGLANVLLETGEIEEAVTWYEKAFEARKVFYGSSNDFTLFTVYRLGYCYYKQGKYAEALDFYQKIVQMLHETGTSGKTVSIFESYILHIQRKITKVHK